MLDWTNGWVLAGTAASGVVLLLAGTFLFLGGCALADVNGPRFPRALAIFGIALVVCLPILGGLYWFAGRYEADPTALFGPMRLLALTGGLAATWVVWALIYALSLAAPYRKGLVIAGTELVLSGLLGALVAGIVLVVLAVMQITRPSSPPPRAAAMAVPLAQVRFWAP